MPVCYITALSCENMRSVGDIKSVVLAPKHKKRLNRRLNERMKKMQQGIQTEMD